MQAILFSEKDSDSVLIPLDHIDYIKKISSGELLIHFRGKILSLSKDGSMYKKTRNITVMDLNRTQINFVDLINFINSEFNEI